MLCAEGPTTSNDCDAITSAITSTCTYDKGAGVLNRYVVTGGAGFIGSHVVEALLARGDEVVIIDSFNDFYDPERKRANLREVVEGAGAGNRLSVVEADLTHPSTASKLLDQRVDAIVHLAAMAGVRNSILDPALYYEVNVMGTLRLLQATIALDPQPVFVFASTSSVYGATDRIPFQEVDPCDRPLVPYSASKRAAELMGYTFHNLYGLDFTALRFFTVYGPRGRPDMMAYKVAKSTRDNSVVPLNNRGLMYRDWTFVSDIVDGVVASVDRRMGYEVINLGRGEPVLLADFVRLVEREMGRSAKLESVPIPRGDVRRTHASIDKARNLLGYHPVVSTEEGVRRFIGWYQRTHRT